ncbi:BspA family leucine-rich repeat surface protein [Metamycoplasma auris]|uniref:Uncharacterized protein DUF285 n=1 Tax=Metamycoplasma auris TaxID=51363 RepID=A0A2W7GW94_9BACT|nr:BspA family leucine-rich repeat surface protein [Metamycoplasma auris]PZW01489.1 uncharacterized protein DUF285 [Metamycoplasma auris]
MNKKIKILTSLSLSLVSLPLIAASCKKKIEPKKDLNTEENNGNKTTNTPPAAHNNTDTSTNSDHSHTHSEQGDQPDNSSSENNTMNSDTPGGTYGMPHGEMRSEDDERKRQEEEAARKQKEEKEKKDMKDVETVKQIVKEHEDAFGSFHTQGDFVEQIAVYAKDKKIEGLQLQNNGDKDKTLEVSPNGGKNKIKLKLGSQKFDVELGIVLKDAVLTKYYYENEPTKILNNLNSVNRNSIEKNWSMVNKTNKKIVITQLGYHVDNGFFKATGLPHYTSKVPEHLPLKINSLYLTFHNLKSSSIDNLDKWDIKNLKNTNQAFYDVSNFQQDISKWKVTDHNIVKSIFNKSNLSSEYKKKIAQSWGTTEDHLSK